VSLARNILVSRELASVGRIPGNPLLTSEGTFNAYDQSQSLQINAEDIISDFEEGLQLDFEERRLQRDDRTHLYYIQALRIALDRVTSHNKANPRPSIHMRDSTSDLRTPTFNRPSSSTSPAERLTPGRPSISADVFGQTEDFQAASHLTGGIYSLDNSYPLASLPSEIAISENAPSISVQAATISARPSAQDVDINLTSMGVQRTNAALTRDPGSSMHAVRSAGIRQIGLIQTEFRGHSWEDISEYNPNIIDFSSFPTIFDEQAPFSLDALSAEQGRFNLGGEAYTEALVDQLGSADHSNGAMTPQYEGNSRSKNARNKYRNAS
jgi:hypothetical protein